MKPKQSDSDLTRLTTSRTMRQKARAISRCIINMLKIWRLCFRSKRHKNNQSSVEINTTK